MDLMRRRMALMGGSLAPAPTIKTVSGALVHILDALERPLLKCEVTLEPIQDLHGYANPWPAGGGVNKFNLSNATVLGTSATYNLTIEINADESIRIHGTPSWSGSLDNPSFNIFSTTDDYSDLVGNVFVVSKSSNITSVNSVTFAQSTGRIAINVTKTGTDAVDFTIRISFASASQSSWSPYSNICPITGHTGCEVYRTGVNVWDEEWESGDIYAEDGQEASNPNVWRTGWIPVLPSTEYYASSPSGNDKNIRTRFYDASKNYIGSIPSGGVAPQTGHSFITPSNAYYLRFAPNNTVIPDHDVSINYPSTDTSYHAYTGTTYPISWQTEAGTVYSGKIDVVSGKLKSAPYYASYNGETLTGHWISDRDVYAEGETPTIGAQVVNDGGTLTEYTLTPTQITALLGENNIWSTGSEVEVIYKASAP